MDFVCHLAGTSLRWAHHPSQEALINFGLLLGNWVVLSYLFRWRPEARSLLTDDRR